MTFEPPFTFTGRRVKLAMTEAGSIVSVAVGPDVVDSASSCVLLVPSVTRDAASLTFPATIVTGVGPVAVGEVVTENVAVRFPPCT